VTVPSDAGARAHANRIGMIAMVACFAVFIVNDTLVKDASEGMPSGQTIFLRGCFSTILTFIAACIAGQWRLRAHMQMPVLCGRAAFDAIGSVGYLIALFHLPIGNATAINSTAPLMLTAAAALILGEYVGFRRWSAILVGFLGIVLVIQPASDGFNAWSILALVATAMNIGRDLVTRRIDPGTPALLVTLIGSMGVTIAAGIFMLLEGWKPPSMGYLLELLMASGFLSAGYFLLVIAMRNGEISLVSAFRYTAIPMALLIGWLRWGEIPNALAWLGLCLLVGAGLYVIHRERVRRRHALRS